MEKSGSELQNTNGNYGMVKMNSETTFKQSSNYFQVKFISMTIVLLCFYHETSIFNPSDVVMNRKYN